MYPRREPRTQKRFIDELSRLLDRFSNLKVNYVEVIQECLDGSKDFNRRRVRVHRLPWKRYPPGAVVTKGEAPSDFGVTTEKVSVEETHEVGEEWKKVSP